MDEHGGDWDPEAGAQQVAQRRERRHLLLVAGLGLVAGLVGALVAVAAGDDLVVTDRLVLVLALAVGLLVVSGGIGLAFVWWRRRRGSATFARSPLWELPSYRQRSRLVKALRRGAPIPPEVRPLAVRVAQDIVRRRAVVGIHLGLAVLQAANFFLQDGWSRWFALVAAPTFLAGAGYFAWLRNRMRDALVRLGS